jgi:pimeloyl-ACP methyl ester carboxylesterase
LALVALLPFCASASATPPTVTRPVPVTLADGRTVVANETLVLVPENRSRPESRSIAINVWGLPAERPGARPPIYILPGGPGGYVGASEIETHPGVRELAARLSRYGEVVFINQRGNPRAPGFTPDLFIDQVKMPVDRPTTAPARRAATRDLVRAAVETWSARGVDLAGYDIVNAADDVADVAAALGHRRVVLVGWSFGGQHSFAVMKRHPALVARALIHGVEPLGNTWDDAGGAWRVFDRIDAAAALDPVLRAGWPEGGLTAALKRVLSRLERQPVTVSVTDSDARTVNVVIGDEDLRALVRWPWSEGPASLRAGVEAWPKFIVELERGDYRHLARLSLEARARPPRRPLIALLIDNSLDISAERLKRLERDPAWAVLGPPDPEYVDTRDLTPTARVDDAFRAFAPPPAPLLMVQGDLDLATPLENALEAKAAMPDAALLQVAGGTHDVLLELLRHDPATFAKVEAFLDAEAAGVAPSSALAAIPERTALPPFVFRPLSGRSLYAIAADGR